MNSEEFGRAQRLWDECAAGLAGELSGGRLSEARLAEVLEFVEWSRVVALSQRAHLQEQLKRLQAELHVAGEYGLPPLASAHCLVAASF